MKNHAAEDEDDQRQVNDANDGDGFAFALCDRHVYRTAREILSGIGMTLAAGARQIHRIDHRVRIARRQNVVYAVITAAIGNGQTSGTQGQAVVTIFERREPFRAYAVFFHNARRSMATPARFNGDVLWGGWRRGFFRRFNRVLGVAVRANWRISGAANYGHAVYAALVFFRDRRMALAAGL